MALIDQIIDSLEKLVNGYGELLNKSKDMQSAIIKGDSAAVSAMAKEQSELAGALGRTESERDGATAALAKEIGFNGVMRLKDVAAHAKPGDKERILELGAELTKTLRAQQQLNEQNRGLLEMQIEYSNFMIESFREPQLNNIYGDTGEIKDDVHLSHIDSEV